MKSLEHSRPGNRPLVSVIVPVYNKKDVLTRCLDSLRAQQIPAEEMSGEAEEQSGKIPEMSGEASEKDRDVFAEVIMVDDGSTDGSREVLLQYEESDDGPIVFRYIRQENSGVSAARNRGLDAAAGKYIAFMDADDWVEQDWLLLMTSAAERRKADEVICGMVRYLPGNSGKGVRQKISVRKRETMPAPAAVFRDTFRADRDRCNVTNKLFRADTIRRGVRFDETIRIGEDLKFCACYFSFAERYVRIPGVQYHYDTTGDGAMKAAKKESFQKYMYGEWRAVCDCGRKYRELPDALKGGRLERKRYALALRIKQLAVALKLIPIMAKSELDEEDARHLLQLRRFVKRHAGCLIHVKRIGRKRLIKGLKYLK